jgi:hypothetical protein
MNVRKSEKRLISPDHHGILSRVNMFIFREDEGKMGQMTGLGERKIV